MHVLDLDNALWLVSDTSQLLLLIILFSRRLHRAFPVFSAFIVWQVTSDLLLLLAQSGYYHSLSRHYVQLYYSLGIVTYLLESGILLEIAANVLSPAKKALPSWTLYFILVLILVFGIGSFLLAVSINPKPFAHLRTFLSMDTTAAILCLVTFVLIAGFSQVLGLSWKNHVLQLATGLAFYSLVALVVELAQSQLHRGTSYAEYAARFQFWSRFGVVGYLCTLYFWCYAFVKKEAPRKEFSPQMAKILVSLSGSAQRQNAVLARTRDH